MADFTRAVGLEMDGTKFGMGKRSQRYSMIVENGVVKSVNVESRAHSMCPARNT